MSRCFPYPPPYLGKAEIESIKKEKERLEKEAKRKWEKKEKKEKRKQEKKEKRSVEKQELSKELKKCLKRKYEELGLVEPDEKHDNSQHCHKSKKPRDDQLTNSCLTEEHGKPNTVGPAGLESPERSQDSSRRIHSGNMPSPSPSLSNNGSTIRIRLQSNSRESMPVSSRESVPDSQTFRQKGSVSAPQVAKSRELAPTRQATKNKEPVLVPQGSKVEEEFLFLLTPNRRTTSTVQKLRAIPGAEQIPKTFTTRATILPTPKSKEPATESIIRKPGEVLSRAPKVVPKENGISGLQKPQGAWRSDSKMVSSALVARPSVSTKPSMKAKLQPCAQNQVPNEREAFQKPAPVMKPKLRDATVSPAINEDLVQILVQPVKPKARDVRAEHVPASRPAPVVQHQVQVLNAKQRVDGLNAHILQQDRRAVSASMQPVVADEPCFSGRISEAEEGRKSKHHHKHSSSKRSKRVAADKLFEELITNWKPPKVDHFLEDEDDLDWLMSGAKKRRVEKEQQGEDDWLTKSSSKCKAGEGLLDRADGTAASMYQTRAVYMPELDIYQLPYVMPF